MKKVIPTNAVLIPNEAKRVFKGILYDVYQWQQKLYDGSYKTFEMLKRFDSVKVLAIVDDKILVNDERQPNKEEYLTIPGGRHDEPNETELQAAQREVLEETGYTFKSWKPLVVYQPHSKLEYFLYFFLAYDVVHKVDPVLDAGEKLTTSLQSLTDVKARAEDGSIKYVPIEILKHVNSLQDLRDWPEFVGETVDRQFIAASCVIGYA